MRVQELDEESIRWKVEVHVFDHVFREIFHLCKNAVPNETVGFLIGDVYYKDETRKEKYVLIEGYVPLPGEEKRTTVHVDRRKLAQVAYTLRQKYPNKIIVGWYHSHPGHGVFLSEDDITTQLYLFPEDYHVALVIDPISRDFAFFKLQGRDGRCRRASFAIWKEVKRKDER